MTTLTPLELVIMKSIWSRRRARVREVQSDLLPGRKLAYTTVLTVLDRLFHKGIVTRTKESRAHVYAPAVSEERARADAVSTLLRDHFGGSPAALRAFLGEDIPPGDAGEAVSPTWPEGRAAEQPAAGPVHGPASAKADGEDRPIDEALL